jgi:hypothetical protein
MFLMFYYYFEFPERICIQKAINITSSVQLIANNFNKQNGHYIYVVQLQIILLDTKATFIPVLKKLNST